MTRKRGNVQNADEISTFYVFWTSGTTCRFSIKSSKQTDLDYFTTGLLTYSWVFTSPVVSITSLLCSLASPQRRQMIYSDQKVPLELMSCPSNSQSNFPFMSAHKEWACSDVPAKGKLESASMTAWEKVLNIEQPNDGSRTMELLTHNKWNLGRIQRSRTTPWCLYSRS